MPSPPLIGVTASITVDKQPERAYVNSAYLRAVQRAGGVPVLLPPQLGAGARDALWNGLAGLLLTGGGDIDPTRFGEPRHPSVYEVSAERDALELELATRAVDGALPLLAICRGIQVLNVARGGSLYQDIPSDPGSLIAHSQTEPRHVATHPVKIEAGTRLATITGAHTLDVNSLHHQAIKAVGRGLVATATAPDSIIEAIESTDGRFVVGVQWHPEDLVGHDPAAEALFAALIAAARRHHR